MENFFHILLHSLIDTAKLAPFLLIVYLLIELLEYKNVFKFQNSKLLRGNASPAMGALFGSIPQCGFSVVSSELYAEQKISIGALIAVFIATSDEAIPIMLSNYKSIPSLLVLIATKILMAIAIGYLAIFFHKKIFKQNKNNLQHISTFDDDNHNEDEHIHACCHHDTQSSKFNWKHPVVHSIKILAYIFIINLIMGSIVEIVGESNLISFLTSSNTFQPLFALLIGLIPNCASSVILTELYLMGGLSFGAIVTGLSVNAGLGILILLRKNKNIKENLFIICILTLPSLLVGYGLHFLPLDFLKI